MCKIQIRPFTRPKCRFFHTRSPRVLLDGFVDILLSLFFFLCFSYPRFPGDTTCEIPLQDEPVFRFLLGDNVRSFPRYRIMNKEPYLKPSIVILELAIFSYESERNLTITNGILRFLRVFSSFCVITSLNK